MLPPAPPSAAEMLVRERFSALWLGLILKTVRRPLAD